MSSSPLESALARSRRDGVALSTARAERASDDGRTPALASPATSTSGQAGKNPVLPYLLAAPHALTLVVFLLLPILAIVLISFWEFNGYQMVPAFTLDNYREILGQATYRAIYLNTFRFAAIVWLCTFAIGFPVAYFLAFHVQSHRTRMVLLLVCTVPFLTSNVIRSISWIPFLGRNGILNSLLQASGVTSHPVEMFLYSDFSIVLSMVHIYTLFMVTPIFNTMMRIDHNLVEAARDLGAGELRIVREIVLPLSLPGVAIGTIFVVSLVLGDYVTVGLMGGGQAASVGLSIQKMITSIQYPIAAANATILLTVTLVVVGMLLRLVDIRGEL
jgi:putative spermidine/putrescine transport system permease protein